MVAPLIFAPFFLHWKLNGVAPVTVTLNLALRPALTVALAGGLVMFGAVFTVNVTVLLVTLPPPLLTTTEKRAPLSASVVAGVM